jgi:peptidoglycan/xylan/chitin deacetylase (PgdA/CDA1 family)
MLDFALRAGLSILAPAGRRSRLSIAIFHRVHSRPDPLFADEPDRVRFEMICRWLKAWFHVLPLDAAVDALRNDRLPSRALSITFDDGYADNHDHALPVLRAHGLTATFFIATGFLDGGRMWNDTIVESLRRCPRSRLDVGDAGLPGITELDLGSTDARRAAIFKVLDAAKYLPSEVREAAVLKLAQRADVPLPSDLMMTSQQVRTMAQRGMHIGAHTVRHPILARLGAEAALQEMSEGRRQLQQIVQQDVRLFAYPNGKPGRDYLPRDAMAARELGFMAAVSTAPGSNDRGTDAFELRRFTPWDRSRLRYGLRFAMNLRQ